MNFNYMRTIFTLVEDILKNLKESKKIKFNKV